MFALIARRFGGGFLFVLLASSWAWCDESPVHPRDLLATIFHAFAINPSTLMYNHLNQPRELVKGTPVTGLFG